MFLIFLISSLAILGAFGAEPPRLPPPGAIGRNSLIDGKLCRFDQHCEKDEYCERHITPFIG